MNNFTLMILCAGFGSRMLNLTRNKPKPLLKYKNKILLKNTIDFFTNIGCDEILVNTHYLHTKIKKYLDKNFKKYPIQIIYEKTILGTGGNRKRALLNHFGSAKSVESASFEDLKSVEGIEEKVAKKIHDFFHDN